MPDLDVNMIRSSFEEVKPIASDVANKFYEILFTDYPASRILFRGVDLDKQQNALIGSLVKIVNSLEEPAQLENYLKGLGSRHVKYGTKVEYYPWVGDCLLKTFAHFFQDKWTEELKSQWTIAYGIISSVMIEGMKDEVSQNQSPAQESAQPATPVVAQESSDVIVVPENVKSKIRTLVQDSVSTYLEQEIKKIVNEEFNKISEEKIAYHFKKVVKN